MVLHTTLVEASQFLAALPTPVAAQGADELPGLIINIYRYSLALVGVAVFFQFFRAGWIYFTAAGNTSKSGEAKTLMTNAVAGTILLFSAVLILNIINPQLRLIHFDKGAFERAVQGDPEALKCLATPSTEGCTLTTPTPEPIGGQEETQEDLTKSLKEVGVRGDADDIRTVEGFEDSVEEHFVDFIGRKCFRCKTNLLRQTARFPSGDSKPTSGVPDPKYLIAINDDEKRLDTVVRIFPEHDQPVIIGGQERDAYIDPYGVIYASVDGNWYLYYPGEFEFEGSSQQDTSDDSSDDGSGDDDDTLDDGDTRL